MSIKADFISSNGEKSGTASLTEGIFSIERINISLIHEVICAMLTNQIQGTASTKTRSDVSGGGIKPWRQKGTGRARTGSIRNPLWRGGGIVFGPHPRAPRINVPQKKRNKALKTALTIKAKEGRILVIDKFDENIKKTKQAQEFLNKAGLKGKKAGLVDISYAEEFVRAFQNIPFLKMLRTDNINTYDVVFCEYIVMTKDAIKDLEKRFNKNESV